MSWMLITTIIGFIIYLVYTTFAEAQFGIPESLSKTYYLYKEKKELLKWLFPAMMVGMAFLLLPALIEASVGSPFQFLAFLMLASICFTGCSPAFMDSDLESKVHTGSAVIAAICGLLWVILVAKLWFVIPIITFVVLLKAILEKTFKKCITYHLEDVTFWSVFSAAILFLI